MIVTKNREKTIAALTLSQNGKRLVLAKFRPRLKHRHRITQRIWCKRESDKRFVGNQSIQHCEKCRDKVKVTDLGVYCSYGLKTQQPADLKVLK